MGTCIPCLSCLLSSLNPQTNMCAHVRPHTHTHTHTHIHIHISIATGRKKRKGGEQQTEEGSDSEGSNGGMTTGDASPSNNGQMVVHQTNQAAQQSLQELADAFMQLLNSHTGPPVRSTRGAGNHAGGPIIEEDPGSFLGGLPDSSELHMPLIGSSPVGGTAADTSYQAMGGMPSSAFAAEPFSGNAQIDTFPSMPVSPGYGQGLTNQMWSSMHLGNPNPDHAANRQTLSIQLSFLTQLTPRVFLQAHRGVSRWLQAG